MSFWFRKKPAYMHTSVYNTDPTAGPVQVFDPVAGLLIGKRGPSNGIKPSAFTDTFKVFNGVIATATTQAVWTPAAGKVIQLSYLAIVITVVADMQFLIGGAVIWENTALTVNQQTVVFMAEPGAFLYPVNSVLNVRNNAGVNPNVSVSAWGTEIDP